jgi:hypothetical protein
LAFLLPFFARPANVVTATEILAMRTHDAPQLPGLVDKSAEAFTIKEASADRRRDCFITPKMPGKQAFGAAKMAF